MISHPITAITAMMLRRVEPGRSSSSAMRNSKHFSPLGRRKRDPDLYFVPSSHTWRIKEPKTAKGGGRSEGTTPYSSDMRKLLPHAVHS